MNATETLNITEGDVVTILGDNRFTDSQGVIIDMNSDLRPEDGPVAIYFDEEVPDHEFYPPGRRARWTSGVPAKNNYRDCCRVRCFIPDELRKDDGFPLETIVRRKFGENYHHISSWKFPLRPGTHACQFESCKTGLLATELTLVNIWGTIQTVYACKGCHDEWHGMRTDGIKLKDPLPGAQ
jgi:hypothetical protein